MAKGYNSSSIIGGPLDQEVLDQLTARSNILKTKTSRTPQQIAFLNSKTGWVKLSSSVNIYSKKDQDAKYTSDLAKNSVLFGGTIADKGTKKKGFDFNGNTNSAYSQYNSMGIRPMPGITGVNIISKNQFGTLRQATVDFKCWSVEQLTELEKLFLRPGFSILLEWGNSVYVDSKGNIQSSIITLSDYFEGSYTKEKVIERIKELKKSSSNNYDGMFGYIKNFQWSYNNEGGYDCQCDIISFGELIESVKIIMTPSFSTGDKNTVVQKNENGEVEVDPEPEKVITSLHSFLYGISTPENVKDIPLQIERNAPFLYNSLIGDILKLGTNYKFRPVVQNGIEISSTDDSKPRKGSFRYIKLRDFLILVNHSFIPVDNNGKRLFSFNTEEKRSLFYTFNNHVGLDPAICLVTSRGGRIIYDTQISAFSANDVTLRESILNINLNVDFLLNQLNTIIVDYKTTSQTVLNLVKSILREVQSNLGDINTFDLHYEEDTFEYFVVDRKLTPNRNDIRQLDITGLKTTVSNLSFVSKITSNLSTMLAVSAQAGVTDDVGVEAENMFRWNEGLQDRIIPTKGVDRTKSEEEKKKVFEENFEQLVLGITDTWNSKRQYNKKEINGLRNIFRSTMRELAKRESNDNKSGAAGIIPFELNLTLDGIGGLKIGQAFTVNKGILPTSYDDLIGFLINGLDHQIDGNRWTTNIKAQTIVLGTKPSIAPPKPVKVQNSDPELDVEDTTIPSDPDIAKDPLKKFIIQDNERGGGELTVDQLVARLNTLPEIQNAFTGFFNELSEKYDGYRALINATYRTIKRSQELKAQNPKNATPGKSPHNYAAAIDMNIIVPSGQMLPKKSKGGNWRATGIPDIARKYGIGWGGDFKNYRDYVHFYYTGVNYKALGDILKDKANPSLAELETNKKEIFDFLG